MNFDGGSLVLQVRVQVLDQRYRQSLSYSACRRILPGSDFASCVHQVSINCGQGEQNVKWLADLARQRAGSESGFGYELLETTLVYLGVDDDRVILFPFDTIADKCSSGDTIVVDLGGLPLHVHQLTPASHSAMCDGLVCVPTLWQCYARSDETAMVSVLFGLKRSRFSVSGNPGIIGK